MAAEAGTEGERRVLAQAPSGEIVDLGDLADDERVVSADVIRRLCLGREAGSVDPRGLRIKSARVVDALDLSFCIVSRPLRFEATTFVSTPDLSGVEIDGHLDFRNGFNATGEVRLIGAKIGGDLNCRNAKLVNTSFQIDRSLAKYVNPRFGSLALNAREAAIGGSPFFDSVKVSGGLDLYRASSATLVDDLGSDDHQLGSWDGVQPLILDAFAYSRFGEDAQWSSKLRKRWLKATTDFQQAAWQQLIEVYRAQGLDDEAARTAIAMQDDRMARAGLSWHRRAGRFVLWALWGMAIAPGWPASGQPRSSRRSPWWSGTGRTCSSRNRAYTVRRNRSPTPQTRFCRSSTLARPTTGNQSDGCAGSTGQ